MSEQLKCKVCGRTFYKHEILDGLNLFAERICPDCKRQRAFSGGDGGNSNAERESAANAKLAEAQAKQVAAATKAQEMAADAAFASSMANLTFSGDPAEIGQDFEIAYQYWLKKGLKRDQKKVVAEKLEFGLMALKKADSVKGDFYEKKVAKEKRKRTTIKIFKIVGITLIVIVWLLIILVLGTNQ